MSADTTPTLHPAIVRDRDVQSECERFAADNLQACCAEVMDYERTGTLSDGLVRKLSRMFRSIAAEQECLTMALSVVRRAAVEAAARVTIDVNEVRSDAFYSGIGSAREGVQEVSAGEDGYPDGTPEQWADKPFARIEWFHDAGDPSVGMQGWSGWVLAADQTGTVVGALGEYCQGDAAAWERFNDLYNQTHGVG